MKNITELVLTSAFSTAFLLFCCGAFLQKLLLKKNTHLAPNTALLELTDSPYQTPVTQPPPLSPQLGKIPIWFYNKFDLISLSVLCLLFFSAAVGNARAAVGSEVVLTPLGLIVSIIMQLMMVGIIIALVIRRINPIDWLGLRWKSWPWVLLIAPACVCGMWVILTTLFAAGYMDWIKSLGVEGVQDSVKLLQTSNDFRVIALMIIAAVFVAPFCEEIVFRGYLYPAMKRFAGKWPAAICSALIFSALHASLAALIPLFIFALVLVFIYEKTGSLWATIAVHLCFNGATVLMQLVARFAHLPLDSFQ